MGEWTPGEVSLSFPSFFPNVTLILGSLEARRCLPGVANARAEFWGFPDFFSLLLSFLGERGHGEGSLGISGKVHKDLSLRIDSERKDHVDAQRKGSFYLMNWGPAVSQDLGRVSSWPLMPPSHPPRPPAHLLS